MENTENDASTVSCTDSSNSDNFFLRSLYKENLSPTTKFMDEWSSSTGSCVAIFSCVELSYCTRSGSFETSIVKDGVSSAHNADKLNLSPFGLPPHNLSMI